MGIPRDVHDACDEGDQGGRALGVGRIKEERLGRVVRLLFREGVENRPGDKDAHCGDPEEESNQGVLDEVAK